MAKPKPSPQVARKVKASPVDADTLSIEARAQSDSNARIGFYSLVFLPWILALVVLGPDAFKGFKDSFHLASHPTKLTPHIVLLVLALSPPHIFYYWTWTHAVHWHALCKERGLVAYKTFAGVAHMIKAFQFLSIFVWAYTRVDLQQIYADVHPLKALLCAQLFLVGQLLNAKVYEKIGEAGVYYGTRLGVKVPWVYGFPFSVVPHPQYFGATLSFAALFLALSTEHAVSEGVYVPMFAVAIMYAFSSWVEANL